MELIFKYNTQIGRIFIILVKNNPLKVRKILLGVTDFCIRVELLNSPG